MSRLSIIELHDVSLAEALELIFKVGDNPAHIIDERAKSVHISSLVLKNIAWDAAVRQVANNYNFKVYKQSGIYIIEPRN